MVNTTFDKVTVKGQFVWNGTHLVKRSKRTAAVFGQPNKWFYFSNKDQVQVVDKFLETKGV